jgi:hypothetical protein
MSVARNRAAAFTGGEGREMGFMTGMAAMERQAGCPRRKTAVRTAAVVTLPAPTQATGEESAELAAARSLTAGAVEAMPLYHLLDLLGWTRATLAALSPEARAAAAKRARFYARNSCAFEMGHWMRLEWALEGVAS